MHNINKLAIMQPYFFPYIGYFQLIAAVDVFVVYDNIQYTKKGWINRNRFLRNGTDATFSLSIKKDSDYLDVNQRQLAIDFDRNKLLRQLLEAYRRAPYFTPTSLLLNEIITSDENNLFNYIYNALLKTCLHLNIKTQLIKSSKINIDHNLKGEEKVIEICRALNATKYINPIGGQELYSRDTFQKNKIELKFLKSRQIQYTQFENEFIPWLSIIDLMMFNSKSVLENVIRNEMDYI